MEWGGVGARSSMHAIPKTSQYIGQQYRDSSFCSTIFDSLYGKQNTETDGHIARRKCAGYMGFSV